MGDILYYGPYVPDPNGNPPSQTFTVTIPAGIQKGRAQLGVAHFTLIGVSCRSISEVQLKFTESYLGGPSTRPTDSQHNSQH